MDRAALSRRVLGSFAAIGVALMTPLSLAGGATPATSAEESPSISQFLKVRVPGSARVAPDGSVYVVDWPDGVNQLYRRAPGAPVKDQGKRLTNFKDGISGYSISPDGKWVVLLFAAGGNENTQISLLNTSTDEITPAQANPKVQHSVNHWLADSSGFIFTANDPSPNDFYVYRYDIASGQRTLLSDKPGQWFVGDATDDGSKLLISNYRSISDSSIYELDTKTGTMTDFTMKGAEGGTASQGFVGYLPGETKALMTADIQDGMEQLFVRDLSNPNAAPTLAIPSVKGYELDGAEMNRERTLLATVHNEDGYGRLRLFRLPSFEPVALPEIEPGVVGSGEIRDGRLIYTLSNARTPNFTFAYTVPAAGQAAGKPTQLTDRMDSEQVDLTKFRLPELIKYSSFDGLQIPAFLYLPEGAKKGVPIPFVAHYHGGPEGQWRPTFDRTVQYLVSQGYGVIQPNVRGSTGYGRAFHMLDDYKNRWNSVKDGVEAARWLVREGYAEEGRIATYGGSYGGYMSVACLVEGGKLFGSGINVVGVVNMKTFLERTSGYRRKLREAEYGPLSDPEFLLSASPSERVNEINVPMLIAHGANDPRVPLNEALQLAVALQSRGIDPEQIYFPDEGHGFAKLQNRIIFAERMVRFLDRTIGKDAAND